MRTADDALVDRVAVTAYGDSACQGDSKLPATLDMPRGESYQRTADGGYLVAPRTPGAANATSADALFDPTFEYPERADLGVAISEIATDPSPEGMPAGTVQRNYIELGNYSQEPVDVGGWTVWRCMVDGARAVEPQFTIPAGTELAPGDVFLGVREGTAAESDADAVYDTSLSLLGTGVWLTDADGRRIDSVGVYAANVLDSPSVLLSPCTKGVALTTYQPDRLLEQTFQRSRFTGVDADDFVVAPATPGTLDEIPWVDPTLRLDVTPDFPDGPPVTAEEAADRTRKARPRRCSKPGAARPSPARSRPSSATPRPASILRTRASCATTPTDYPYQRLILDADEMVAGSTVSWSGTGEGRSEVQLSIWTGESWRLVDAGTGDQMLLRGVVEEREIRDRRVTLLVQNGPRTEATLASGIDGELADPSTYDFAVSHITDTQYLTESYPEVYAGIVSWIAANQDGRKIEFATHTGDIIQNFVEPEQNDDRARREFERASAIQSILDDAGVPNSVLPGNHDNRTRCRRVAVQRVLPRRAVRRPALVRRVAVGRRQFGELLDLLEHEGALFLMLSLPYAYDDTEMDWAAEVVASHPEYNVIISTHEHVTPKTIDSAAARSTSGRWVSRGQELWDRVIAPNRNVVLVLRGPLPRSR